MNPSNYAPPAALIALLWMLVAPANAQTCAVANFTPGNEQPSIPDGATIMSAWSHAAVSEEDIAQLSDDMMATIQLADGVDINIRNAAHVVYRLATDTDDPVRARLSGPVLRDYVQTAERAWQFAQQKLLDLRLRRQSVDEIARAWNAAEHNHFAEVDSEAQFDVRALAQRVSVACLDGMLRMDGLGEQLRLTRLAILTEADRAAIQSSPAPLQFSDVVCSDCRLMKHYLEEASRRSEIPVLIAVAEDSAYIFLSDPRVFFAPFTVYRVERADSRATFVLAGFGLELSR